MIWSSERQQPLEGGDRSAARAPPRSAPVNENGPAVIFSAHGVLLRSGTAGGCARGSGGAARAPREQRAHDAAPRSSRPTNGLSGGGSAARRPRASCCAGLDEREVGVGARLEAALAGEAEAARRGSRRARRPGGRAQSAAQAVAEHERQVRLGAGDAAPGRERARRCLERGRATASGRSATIGRSPARERAPTAPRARRAAAAAARTWRRRRAARRPRRSAPGSAGRSRSVTSTPRARASATRATPRPLETCTTCSAQPASSASSSARAIASSSATTGRERQVVAHAGAPAGARAPRQRGGQRVALGVHGDRQPERGPPPRMPS